MSSSESSLQSVDLVEAIEALRSSFERVWELGSGRRVRFRPAPVELKIEVAVTRAAEGAAGLSWQILTLGGKRSQQSVATHTLTVQLTPVVTDGLDAENADQLIGDLDDGR